MKRSFATIALLTVLLSAASVSAQQPRHSMYWKDTTAIRYNPLGLVTAAELDYRLRMYNSGATLFNNYVSLAATPIVSPAYTRLGAKLEIVPLALLSLAAKYEYILYFGTFDFLQSFPDQRSEMSDDAIEANAEEDLNYATSGQQLSFIGLLQAKVGPIAVRNRYTLFNVNYDVNDGDTVFYDPFLDNVLPAEGWGHTNELDLLYLRKRLVAGLRWTHVKAFLDEVPDDPNEAQNRLGPLVLYEVYRKRKGGLTSIKVLGLFQWYLQHRYRRGQETTAALPMLAVGAIFEGRVF